MSVDISDCTALKKFDSINWKFTSLNASGCTVLETLCCAIFDYPLEYKYSDPTSIDVSGCTALTDLDCCGNHLTSLDVSDCTALTDLDCRRNQLTSLDVSKNTALTSLGCPYNQLTSLDVSKNTALKELDCGNNPLTSLNVSKNTVLTRLYYSYTQLTSFDLSKHTALKSLGCSGNQLASLDVSKHTALEDLACDNNQLTSLDVSNNTALTSLYCSNNQLTSLDVSNNTSLKWLRCYSNHIKGAAMDALVKNLPAVEHGYFVIIDTKDEHEENVITKKQVAVAKGKGWRVYDSNGSSQEYEGSEDEILLDEENFPDDNFRVALAKDLGIAEGDKINTGLIVATTKIDVSNGKITMLSGIEYFTALTTIYCQSNMISGNAIKGLIAALPDLSSNGAKGMMRAEETNPRAGALYVLDFTDENEQNVCTAEHVAAANAKGWTVYCKTANGWQEYNGEIPTGIDSIDNGKLTIDNWYSVDGVKLQGEPRKKGIYIRNGKKVVK